MNLLKYIVANIIETLLRVLPFPCRTGLVKVGNPDRNSPVFLTCNYHLTVQRVKRALEGMDCYLLVANSRGINVWCAATGGLLTNHDAISVLRTSGIEDLVDHREIILPQLAATGIEAKVIEGKTGWKAIWGPVYADDIPGFLENDFSKPPEMRKVEFLWLQRVEMAVAWAFPISLLVALIVLPLWRGAVFPLAVLIWGLAFLIFMSFPLYERWFSPGGRRFGFVFFDFGRAGLPLALWGIFMVGLVAYTALAGQFAWGTILRWGLASLVIVLVITLDLMGSTPVYKSGLHQDRLFRISIDEKKCRGVGVCVEVCPRDCFELDAGRHVATMPRADECVQCGACIVQCPCDALCFESPDGQLVAPEDVRRYKLNMTGKRLVKAEGE
jgi:NAD-dependent dihydropyrimidine dehydrogenase PreA subunit